MSSTRARVIAGVRILIGIGFLWTGIRMLMNHDLLFGGLLHRLSETGGPVRFYRENFLRYIERYETAVVYLSAAANIGAGFFFLTGTLISLTSLGAAALVLNYGLASSAGNWPRMLAHVVAALLLVALGWLGAGLTWGVDGWLIQRFQDWLVLFPLRRKAPGKKE
ncbi:MAG: hypothetical protein HY234_03260 [Acidobacteria bacterium]|nr:hypothetical protein [Acidobacteriota bacterium]